MAVSSKSKEELIEEVEALRSRLEGLHRSRAVHEKAEKALRESEARFRTVIESLPFDFFLIDKSGRYAMLNEACKRHWGDVVGKRPEDICPDPDTLALWQSNNRRAFAGEVVEGEVTLQPEAKEGYYRNIISPIRDGDRIRGILGVNIDITRYKEAESALQETTRLLETIFDATHVLIACMDPQFNFIKVNRAYAQADEQEQSFFPGKNHFDLYPNEENEAIFRRVVETGKPYLAEAKPFEYSEHPERGVSYWDWSLIPIKDPNNHVTGLVLSLANVTERRRAEKALAESEGKLNAMLQSVADHMSMLDEDLTIIWANEAAMSIFGKDIVGRKCYEAYHGRDKPCEPHPCISLRALQDGNIHEHDTQVVGKDGKTRHFHCSANVALRDSEGKPTAVLEISRDITEQKRVEQALRESESNYRAVVENAAEGIVVVQDGMLRFVNPKFASSSGYSEEELMSRPFTEFVHPDHRERVMGIHIKRLEGGEVPPIYEVKILDKQGNARWLENNGILIEWGDRPATLNFLRDITERKRAEESLQRRLEFERLVTTLCTGFINPGHIDEKIGKTLKAIGEFAGVDRAYVFQLREDGKTADNTHEWCADGIPPQIEGLKGIVLDEALPWFWEKLKAQGTFHVPAVADFPPEAHLEKAHFEMQQIQALIVVPMLSEGSLRGFLGFDSVRSRKTWSHDIIALLTIAGENISLALDRERAEGRLRESKDILEKTFSSLDSAIFILDAEESPTVLDCNPAATRVFGYEKEQMVGQTTEFLHLSKESLLEFQRTLYQGVEEQGYLSFFEFKMKRKSGEIFPSEHSVLPLKSDDGGRIGWISVVRDMTDRVQAEEALRQSEERYRKLFEEAEDGILLGDAQSGVIVDCNRAAAEMLDRGKSELIGQHQSMIHPPSRIKDGYSVTFKKHVHESEGQVLEDQIITRTGQIKEVAIKANFVEVGDRRLLQAMFRDITERKRAENALRESESRHRSMIELAPDAIIVLNKLGVLVSCNSAAEKISGYSKDELVGKHFSKLGTFGLKDIPRYLDLFAKILKGRIREPFEVDFIRRDGTNGIAEIRVNPLGDGNIQAIVTDISDRKQAEQRLLEDRTKLKSLASQLSLTEERERRQIATELHDRIGQSLVISKIKLDELRESADSGEFTKALQEVCDTLGQVIQDTRVLTFDLSFPILYELGFEAAVAEWLAEQIQERHGIETKFEDDGKPKPLDGDIRVILFRNVRELLINVVKHANAQNVKVSIRRVGHKICVTVEDDGVGFDPAEATSMTTEKATFGLFSIRERLEQLEGYLEIQAERGRGSKITMTAPLKH